MEDQTLLELAWPRFVYTSYLLSVLSLVGSNMLRAYLFFIYASYLVHLFNELGSYQDQSKRSINLVRVRRFYG